MAIIRTSTSDPLTLTGRYQVTIVGTATVQVSPSLEVNGAYTWMSALNTVGNAVTGTNVTFTVEFGQDHQTRVTGAGTVLFGRIPNTTTNVA